MRVQAKHFLIIAILIVAALAGCQGNEAATPAEADVQIDLSVDPAEPLVGDATLVVSLKDADGAPINDAKVAVRGSMNHAGMVPVLGDTDAAENGAYTIPFKWTMGGDWFVDVTVTLADGTTATKSFDYTVSGGMNMSGDESDS